MLNSFEIDNQKVAESILDVLSYDQGDNPDMSDGSPFYVNALQVISDALDLAEKRGYERAKAECELSCTDGDANMVVVGLIGITLAIFWAIIPVR